MFDYISQGVPVVQAPSAPALLADVVNGRLYVSVTSGGFVNVANGTTTNQTASGALVVNNSALYIVTKSSAPALLTLAAPTAAGVRITVTSDSAQAHTLTATALIQDGTTGGPHNLATFAAFPGATISLVSSISLKWNVVSLQNVVIS